MHGPSSQGPVRQSPDGRSRTPQSKAFGLLLDRPWAFMVVGGLVAFALWAVHSRSSDHTIKAAFTSAVSISPGLDVQIDGVDVGKIGKVTYQDGQALVDIGVNNDAWPLHQGTTATLRFGTTLGNGTRLVDLQPGPKSAPTIAENGIITTKDTVTPVEFDQVFDTFAPKTRAAFRSFFGGGVRNLAGRQTDLNGGIRKAAPALEGVSDVFNDIASNTAALRSLVTQGYRATQVLAARRPQISGLVANAATTFDAFAKNSDGIRDSLDEFAPTLVDARTTLRRADRSINGLDGLVSDLKGPVAALKPFATVAGSAAADLSRVAPAAASTLATLRATSPRIASLLREGVPFSQKLAPVLATASEQLQCVRPYAPEIAAFFSNWGSWAQGYDNRSHYGRIKAVFNATSMTSYPPTNTAAFLKSAGTGLTYAMPRPPGLNAGRPWLLPECGAGADALNPAKDPEDK